MNEPCLTPAMPECTRCNRHEGCGRPGIPSRIGDVLGGTSAGPALLIVGEQPGFYEEQTGECFRGKSGAYLADVYLHWELLAYFSVVYYSNAIRCLHRRNIAVSHLGHCRPYLMADIRAILDHHGALVILAIGRAAAQCLLNRGLRDAFKIQGNPLPNAFWVNFPRLKKGMPEPEIAGELLPKGWIHVDAEDFRPEPTKSESCEILPGMQGTIPANKTSSQTAERLLLAGVYNSRTRGDKRSPLEGRKHPEQRQIEKEESNQCSGAGNSLEGNPQRKIDSSHDLRTLSSSGIDRSPSRRLHQTTGSRMDLSSVSSPRAPRKQEIKAIIPVFSTYHPAALMSGRNPSYRRAVFDHLSLLLHTMQNHQPPEAVASGELPILADVTWTSPGATHRIPEIQE